MKTLKQKFSPKLPKPVLRTISLKLQKDAIVWLREIAKRRNMTPQELMVVYIEEGLQKDLTEFFADKVLETTAKILGTSPDNQDGEE